MAQSWLLGKIDSPFVRVPEKNDSLHQEANRPKIKIISPQSQQVVSAPSFLIKAEVTAPLGVKQVDFFFNDIFLDSSLTPPYQLTLALPGSITNGLNYIKVRAYDWALNRQEESREIFINL